MPTAKPLQPHTPYGAMYRWALSLAVSAATACAADGPATNGVETAIIGGSEAQTGQFPTVVALAAQGGPTAYQVFCSGTLVAPDIVLTAAHCQEVEDQIGTIWVIVDGMRPQEGQGTAIEVTQSVRDPSWDSLNVFGVDVAVLFLATPVTDRPPSPIMLTPLAAGDAITAVGYGTADVDDGGSAGVQRYLAEEATIDCNDTIEFLLDQWQMSQDDLDYALGGRELGDLAVCTNMADNTGVCFGDSGGPAFASRDGVLEVAGVASFVSDGDCANYGFHARPSNALEFFRQHAPALLCQADGECHPDCQGGVDIDCGCESFADCGALIGRHECIDDACVAVPDGAWGEACAGNDDCASDYCNPEGLCAQTCANDEACPTNSHCEGASDVALGECALDDDEGCGCSGAGPAEANAVIAIALIWLGRPRRRLSNN